MSYSIITIEQKDKWNEYVQSCKIFDFYHTWYYHSLEKKGEPILFVYEVDNLIIAFPLIRREIDGINYSDLTSVYGYAGPISNMGFENICDFQMQGFKESFLKYLNEDKNVSVFCRLHPIINHDILVKKFGSIRNNGKTVAIDLTIPIEEQRSKYRRQFRSKIKQLRKKGYYLKKASTVEEIQAFVQIYNDNMSRVKAASSYCFDEKYFFNMLASEEFGSSVLLLFSESEITCGAIVTYSNNIMQFHLAATNNKFLHEGPMKMLIDEASLVGREKFMQYLHLGGGVGGKEDSLFEFKAGFSDTILDFNTWRFVHDKKIYDDLVSDKTDNYGIFSDFFPLYRDRESALV